MATRLKTIEYWFPHLATVADASAASFTQITIDIPEASSTITFRKVIADLVIADVNTTLANVTQRQIEIQLAAAGYNAVNNTQTYTQSGENFAFHHSTEHTSYFTTNWTGTSMTCDARVTVNTGTLGCRNASLRLIITYEYDDTVTTQIKTVWVPLNAPVNALGTTKPGTATDTIPALDTYCPEASKTYRQICIVVQGNTEGNGAVDKSLSFEVDSLGAFTSQLYELGTTVDLWYRLNEVVTFDTSATRSFYLWGSTADFDHAQVWMVVTYEFNSSTTTSVLNSLIMPMEFDGVMGYNNTGYQRAKRDIMIEEPSTITLQRLAYYMFYDKMAAISGLNARVGTGSFVAYTCVAAVLAGGAGLMIRNDGAYTFDRGRNTISVDVYRTDTADLGYNVSGFWIVNYTSGKHANGVGVHNHTVIWNLFNVGTTAAAAERITSATAITLPASNYYLSGIGISYVYTSNTTGVPSGAHIGAERLSGEGGIAWEQVYEGIGGSDAETGVHQVWATARTVFKRWANEYDSNRLDIETSRRWRADLGQSCASFDTLDLILTYHSIQFTVSGNITGSSGGTVNLYLCRASSGERLLSTTRVGNGSYSFTWYDNTEDVYVDAYEDDTHLGRSKTDVAS